MCGNVFAIKLHYIYPQSIRFLCMGLLKVWPLSVWPKSLCNCTDCVPVMKIKLFLSSLVCSPHQFHFWVRPNRQIIMWKSLRSRSCHKHTQTHARMKSIPPFDDVTVRQVKKSKLKLSKVCRRLTECMVLNWKLLEILGRGYTLTSLAINSYRWSISMDAVCSIFSLSFSI